MLIKQSLLCPLNGTAIGRVATCLLGNVIHVQSDLMQLLGVVGKWHLWEISALFAKGVQVTVVLLGCSITFNLPIFFIKLSSLNIFRKNIYLYFVYICILMCAATA